MVLVLTRQIVAQTDREPLTNQHSRKTVHDEVMKQCTEEQCEVILGSDRYGAKYFWFPMFLKNDLRVYRHCIDNTILSTVKVKKSR